MPFWVKLARRLGGTARRHLRQAKALFRGDFPLVEGKIRVRFGPYETKAFLFVNDHVVFGLKRERKGGDAYEDV